LVDEMSMSTSEILAGGLRDLKRVRIFGTPTPGAALPSHIEKLPSGDRFQFAVANYISAGGDVLEGVGVAPDELVKPDRAALLAGRDPVIEAAVTWINSQSTTGSVK
jgi:carboxyl-terminal processing protease